MGQGGMRGSWRGGRRWFACRPSTADSGLVGLTRTDKALPPWDAVIVTTRRQRNVNREKPRGHRRCPIWWGEAPQVWGVTDYGRVGPVPPEPCRTTVRHAVSTLGKQVTPATPRCSSTTPASKPRGARGALRAAGPCPCATAEPPKLLVLNGCNTLDGAEVLLEATP